jgi:hypothetical protein
MIQQDHPWQIEGEKYGYPQCCIDEFILWAGTQGPRKFDGSGYKPCIKCNKKSHEELIEVIKSNRKYHHKFPVGEDYETNRYFDSDYLVKLL